MIQSTLIPVAAHCAIRPSHARPASHLPAAIACDHVGQPASTISTYFGSTPASTSIGLIIADHAGEPTQIFLPVKSEIFFSELPFGVA